MKSFLSRAGRLWCSLMHQAPMWPMRGYYRCSICMRTYPVLWAHKEALAAGPGRMSPAMERTVTQIGNFAVAPVAFAGDRRRSSGTVESRCA